MQRQQCRPPSTSSAPNQTVLPEGYIDASVFRGVEVQHIPLGTPDDRRTPLDIALWHDLVILTLYAPRVHPFTWQDYTWELTGSWPQPEGTLTPNTFSCDTLNRCTGFPWVYERCRRIYHRATPVYLEMRWYPEHPALLAIKGIASDSRKGSVDLIHKGLALLKALEPVGGRPPDIEDRRAFWRLYWDAYQKILEDKRGYGNRLPSKTEVAQALLISPKTFKRYRDRYGLTWPPPPPPETL
jgi:hypothetical protein